MNNIDTELECNGDKCTEPMCNHHLTSVYYYIIAQLECYEYINDYINTEPVITSTQNNYIIITSTEKQNLMIFTKIANIDIDELKV